MCTGVLSAGFAPVLADARASSGVRCLTRGPDSRDRAPPFPLGGRETFPRAAAQPPVPSLKAFFSAMRTSPPGAGWHSLLWKRPDYSELLVAEKILQRANKSGILRESPERLG